MRHSHSTVNVSSTRRQRHAAAPCGRWMMKPSRCRSSTRHLRSPNDASSRHANRNRRDYQILSRAKYANEPTVLRCAHGVHEMASAESRNIVFQKAAEKCCRNDLGRAGADAFHAFHVTSLFLIPAATASIRACVCVPARTTLSTLRAV